MDFKSFIETAKLLPVDNSVLIRGRHGIGKSECVYQLARENFKLPVMERRISQITEGDLIGLPFKIEEVPSKHEDENEKRVSDEIHGACTSFLPLDWFVACMKKPHVIFLDEIDRGSYEVQQAVFELILDRSIQGRKVHEGCRIYAAINGGIHGAQYNVNAMDPAMSDRFFTVDLEPTVQDWIDWGLKGERILSKILDFVQIEGANHLEFRGELESSKVYPSRRSWVKFNDTLITLPEILADPKSDRSYSLLTNIGSGFLGIEATSAFLRFLTDEKTYSAEDIFDNFAEHKKDFWDLAKDCRNKDVRTELHNNIIDKLATYIATQAKENEEKEEKKKVDAINKGQLENMYRYFLCLSDELKQAMWTKICGSQKGPSAIPIDISSKFAAKISHVMVELVK